MAMSDEAMFAPPQGITIEAVNGMLAERLAQKHGKASLLRAFIPLPPPFSPVQLIELHVLKSNFYYRYHDDGCCSDDLGALAKAFDDGLFCFFGVLVRFMHAGY